MKENNLQTYPLFVAMTRPPMMLGVTQTFFVMNFVPCFCFLLISKSITISLGIFVILHVVGVLGCAKDNSFFEIFLGKYSFSCPNKQIWGCNSYDPE